MTPRKPQPSGIVNHRTKVGIERRERTRAKLLKGALVVFAGHGVDAKAIDRVIKESGLSRGTFYNYFRTNDELFMELAREVSDEVIRIVQPLVDRQREPAARIACGVSTALRLAMAYPVFAQFVVRGGPAAVRAGNVVNEVVSFDIRTGIASGKLTVPDEKLAFDLVVGPVIMAFHTVLTNQVSNTYPQQLAQAVLQSLGVSKSAAQRYSRRNFGDFDIAEDSLFSLQRPQRFSR